MTADLGRFYWSLHVISQMPVLVSYVWNSAKVGKEPTENTILETVDQQHFFFFLRIHIEFSYLKQLESRKEKV